MYEIWVVQTTKSWDEREWIDQVKIVKSQGRFSQISLLSRVEKDVETLESNFLIYIRIFLNAI